MSTRTYKMHKQPENYDNTQLFCIFQQSFGWWRKYEEKKTCSAK